MHNGILFSHKEKLNHYIVRKEYDTENHYGKQNKY